MKWYKHDPAAFLEGTTELTLEERGAYIVLIDLLYARAPANHVTDELVMSAAGINRQRWNRLKTSLMAKGKIHENDGHLTANSFKKVLEKFQETSKNVASLRARRLKNQWLRQIPTVLENTEYRLSKREPEKGSELERLVRDKGWAK